MRARWGRTAVLVGVAATAIALTSTVALAVSLVNHHASQQASTTTVSISGLKGLTFEDAFLQPGTQNLTSVCAFNDCYIHVALASGANSYCLTLPECVAGNATEQVFYAFNTSQGLPLNTYITIIGSVVGTPNFYWMGIQLFLTSAVAGGISFYFDLGSETSISSITVTASTFGS